MFLSFISQLKQWNLWTACNLSSTNKRNQINALFWGCLCFSIAYLYFSKLLRPVLRKSKIEYYKWNITIRSIWNICFHIVAIIFLLLYQKYFLASSLYFKQNGQNYYRSYENLLFHRTDNSCSVFNSMNIILLSFYFSDFLYELNEKSFTEAIRKVLTCCIVICSDTYRLEYFAVSFNILVVFFNLFGDVLRIISWHTLQENHFIFQICMFLKLFVWSYIFLNVLPFMYLIPTLNGRKFYLWLKLFLCLWYGASVWNSPILQYFYHQIYHVNHYADCIGGGSISICILIIDSQEIRHHRNLQRALIEIQLAQKEKYNKTERASAKTYQTIKCVLAIKRKLKRIRETKENSGMETSKL